MLYSFIKYNIFCYFAGPQIININYNKAFFLIIFARNAAEFG